MAKKAFEEEIYRKITLCDLILFGISSVLDKKEKCSFEDMVKECFSLFPKSFSFSQFPKWPDSRKFDRQIRFLRKKKLLIGRPETFLSLTKTGQKRVEEIAKLFRQRRLKI